MEKKTVFYDKHVAAGGKIVPFAGWLLPVQYTGILAEHKAVRENVGMFDVSHMGEITLKGADALANLNKLLTNDYTSLKDGGVRYSPMCYPDGGTVDDLLVYKKADNDYLIVVNASNKDKDYAWMKENAFGDAEFTDISDDVAQIAIQGPNAEKMMAPIASELPQKYYSFVDNVDVAGIKCLVSRTGYTGEAGYEIYCAKEDGEALWDVLVAAGAELGMLHCGLGCRDTLRLEAAMPLYGHELSAEITPKECGLGFAIKMDKADFIGKAGLEAAAERERIGLVLTDRGIAREGAKVYANGEEIGYVTSGTSAPYIGKSIAMALVKKGERADIAVEVRGKMLKCEEVALPFYKKK